MIPRKRSRASGGCLSIHVTSFFSDDSRYIVEFFPETLDGPDNEGRTPLHYAAVAPVIDVNFYQLLKEAGADINIKDKVSAHRR